LFWLFIYLFKTRRHGKLPTPGLITPKVYCYNLHNQPKEEIARYSFWVYPKLDLFFVMDESTMPMVKEKELNFGSPHNYLL
jgi:hypothetical protein